jgi:D-serine deaminase-like pyridoxal phosphate-dependent protein
VNSRYHIADTSQIITPALIVFREIVEANLDRMVQIAGDPVRLRPHCKTHKMSEVVALELARGIRKHKAATIAEAEMLARAGADDVLLAYNIVGPNIERVVRLTAMSGVRFSVTADHPRPIEQLSRAVAAAGRTIDVLLDIDTGQHRTGVPVGPQAAELYRQIASSPGLRAGGFHVYDGHNHQTDLAERTADVDAGWNAVARFRDELAAAGLSVPRIVAGGTGSFPIYAAKNDPAIELSPGTCVFHDAGYARAFPDLEFTPAALLLTRVISRPTPDRITLDLGYKAVASDPPAGQRLVLPDLPDAEHVLQNEEHLVVQTARAEEFAPGDELLAIPRHVCPTSALHKEAYVVANGEVVGTWQIIGRDRRLTI